METIIQKLQRYTKEDPNAVILYDDAHSGGFSYAMVGVWRICSLSPKRSS